MRCTINDIEAVERVMKHPSIFPNIVDDGTPSIKEYSMGGTLECESIYVLMPSKDTVVIVSPLNNTTYDFHPNIIKERRGAKGDKDFTEALNYIFTKTPAMKIVGFIPTCFKNVKAHSERFGFIDQGMLTQSIMKNGKAYDQWIVSMEKNRWLK